MRSINRVTIVGRLTKDPVTRYQASTLKACARFNVALDRGADKDGNSRGADFPSIVCFGGLAETADKYLRKGLLVAIDGRIHTGDYTKDGRKIYFTEIVADSIIFLDKATVDVPDGGASVTDIAGDGGEWGRQESMFDGFSAADDVPF